MGLPSIGQCIGLKSAAKKDEEKAKKVSQWDKVIVLKSPGDSVSSIEQPPEDASKKVSPTRSKARMSFRRCFGHLDGKQKQTPVVTNGKRSSQDKTVTPHDATPDSTPASTPYTSPEKSPTRRNVSGILCSLPSELLVDAATFNRRFDVEAAPGIKAERLGKGGSSMLDTYDSMLMDTQSTLASMDLTDLAPSYDGASDLPDLPEESLASLDKSDKLAAIEGEEYDTFGSPQWMIDPLDIFFVARGSGSGKACRLGRGAYGPVYLGIWHENDVAVKLSKQKPITLKAERQFHAKVAQLSGISHPNVLKFHGACVWKGGKRLVAVTEFMEGGTLQMLLMKGKFPEQLSWAKDGKLIALDIAQGLMHLHAKEIVHGRLKCSNVLFDRGGCAKIGDASLAQLFKNTKRSRSAGSYLQEPNVIAPEVAAGGPASKEADVYALGAVLWRLLTLEDASVTMRAIRAPVEAPAKIAWLISCCLDSEPEARPTARMLSSVIASTMKANVKVGQQV